MKKRFLTVVGLTAGVLVGVTATVQAQFSYEIHDGTVTITGYTGPGGDVVIPDTIAEKPVREIGWAAFSGCTSLTSIVIPDSVTYIPSYAFEGCTSLSAIDVDTLNPAYSSVAGVVFNKSQEQLTHYPGGKAGSYTIPDSVTDIRLGAFAGCTGLTSITIPDSVTSVGEFAFYGCTSLTRVIVPDRVTNLGAGMISGCTNLKGLYFLGDAPRVMPFGATPGLFLGPADQTIVYYLPETTGWYSTLGDLPTAVWKPQVLASEGDFGVRDGHLTFDIFWARNKVVVVEACADLANPDWVQVGTRTLTENVTPFSGPEAASQPGRFYRLREQ